MSHGERQLPKLETCQQVIAMVILRIGLSSVTVHHGRDQQHRRPVHYGEYEGTPIDELVTQK